MSSFTEVREFLASRGEGKGEERLMKLPYLMKFNRVNDIRLPSKLQSLEKYAEHLPKHRWNKFIRNLDDEALKEEIRGKQKFILKSKYTDH